MRIGFDVSQTGRSKAGCGYFAESLIRHLAGIDSENEYVLYPTFGDLYWDPDWPTSTVSIGQPNFRRGLGHRTLEAAQFFWRNPPSDLETQLGNADIIHANNFFSPGRLQKARLVYTLHDLAFLEHPEWTMEQNRVGCFGGVFNASLCADLIIAVSAYTRGHFLETFPHYPVDRVVVVSEASRFSPRPDLVRPPSLPPLRPDHFWLNVGTLEPRKNHRRLLRAYARLKEHLGETGPLVLAGGQGWLMGDFEKAMDDLTLLHDVVLLGYADDEALQWLYQNCFAFVYPSLFEGFGLPVLEAMSLGAPVLTSDTTSLPEIVGTAGLLVNPLQEEDIFQAMLKLSTGQVSREVLKEMALQRSRSFSWTHTAEAVLQRYKDVASIPKWSAQLGYGKLPVRAKSAVPC
jgi:glycosyltransferase involved in cell wall biosynthesis